MEEEEDVLFQDFLYKLKQSKSGRFNRLVQERWKMKYFVLSCCGSQLTLKSYNKKPKQLHNSSPKAQLDLCPSFKVEKLSKCHNRAFAMELTAPTHQLCLSAEEQTTVDKFVFLLLTQIRLRDNITDNLVEVRTDQSEAFTRIGAKGANCVLHVSPWGLTLVLKQSRAVLAQWPLKSIRYYESSGQGQFTIEAGMVAPMGEGVFVFHTHQGLDNRLYDTVDHYVINTLDRVKPSQRGTPEEIEDYIREFDCLHSLTTLTPTPLANSMEVGKLLRDNWSSAFTGAGESSNRQTVGEEVRTSSPDIRSATPRPEPPSPRSPVSPPVPSPGSPLTSNNANRPLPTPQSPRTLPTPQSPRALPSPRSARAEQRQLSPSLQRQWDAVRHRSSPAKDEEGRVVSGRPPPPPPRPGVQGSARVGGRGSPRSARQDSCDGAVASPLSAELEPRRHSNPATVAQKVTHGMDIHPAIRKQMSYDSNAAGVVENSLSHVQRFPPNSPGSPTPSPSGGSAERSSCPVPSVSPRISETDGAENGDHKLDAPVEDWLVSASCEDLSDHMRAVIFQQRRSQLLAAAGAPPSTSPPVRKQTSSNNNDPDFIPPPFENILSFRSGVDLERNKARDRSQSFDVNSRMQKGSNLKNGAAGGSASPSIRQIRKMVSARTVTKENLRKSLSNPNYLNLGSKERLYQHRVQAPKPSQQDKEEAAKLSAQNKHKSRSLASLLPSSLRRYLSKESLSSRPASTTPSPDMRRTRHTTPTTDDDENFRRKHSARSLREMSIKGIHFTDQSRSFRRPKGYQRSKSADPNLRLRTGAEDQAASDENVQVDARSGLLSSTERCVSAEAGVGLGRRVGEGGDYIETDRMAGNAGVNGVVPPDRREGKLRLPSRSTSQSTC